MNNFNPTFNSNLVYSSLTIMVLFLKSLQGIQPLSMDCSSPVQSCPATLKSMNCSFKYQVWAICNLLDLWVVPYQFQAVTQLTAHFQFRTIQHATPRYMSNSLLISCKLSNNSYIYGMLFSSLELFRNFHIYKLLFINSELTYNC